MPTSATVAAAIALFVLFLAFSVYAVPSQSDYTNWQVPSQNGTANNTNITGRAQMYVGFYGNMSIQVRNNTATGNVLYQKNVEYGKLYFFKAGATPGSVFLNASTNATVNGNFSLTGAYNLSYHFDVTTIEPYCGVNNASVLNTTDNRRTAILYDNTAPPSTNYFFCTQLGSFTSTNGFGTINYEIIVAKTPTYMSYDIWFDLQ